MKKVILAAALTTAAFSAIAEEGVNKNFYVQFNSGYAHGISPNKDFPKGDMGDTSVFGLEAGYKVDEHFRTSVSFDYMPSFSNKETSTDGDIIKDGNIKVKSYVSMLNLYYDIIEYNKFTPYLTLGAGIARNRTGLYTENFSSNKTNLVETVVYENATKTNFAYKLGIGSKYEINNSFDLDLRYQFTDLGKFKTGTIEKAYENGAYVDSANSTAKSGKLRAHQILVGLAYKF